MKLITILFLFFITLTNLWSKDTLDVALYGVDKKIATEKTVKTLLTNLFKKIDKLKDLELNTFFYKDKNELINDFKSKNNKFDILYTMPSLYIENYELFNKGSKNLVSLNFNNEKYIQYYLITNKKTGLNSIKDLKGKKLVLAGTDNLSKIWFDKISYESTQKSYTTYIKKEISNYSRHKKLLDIYFNKVDIAIVSKSTYDVMVDLNPTIAKNIKILKKSPAIFPYVLGIVHSSAGSSVIDEYNNFILDSSNADYISSLLNLVKLKNLENCEKTDFEETYKLYNEYLKLKNKYN